MAIPGFLNSKPEAKPVKKREATVSNTGWYYVVKFHSTPPAGPGIRRHHVQDYAEALILKDQLNAKLSEEERNRGVHWDIQDAPLPCRPLKHPNKVRRSRRQNPSDRRNRR